MQNKDLQKSHLTTSTNLSSFNEKELMQFLDGIMPGVALDLEDSHACNIVYLLIDHSGSMAGANKLDQAKEGAIDFAKDAIRKGYQVGIIVFSSKVEEICSPNKDTEILQLKLKPIISTGCTYMCKAIEVATVKLNFHSGCGVICLVTDGMPNSVKGALDAAKKAKLQGIEIMTIGTDDADRAFLAQIASSQKLSVKVESQHLKSAISRMSQYLALPAPNK